MLLRSFLAGKCLCEVEMALHHKAAHVLGGSFGMEHSGVHTVLQSYVLAYQWPHLSSGIQSDFQRVLDADYPPKVLKELAEHAGAKTNLKSIGFKEVDIEKAAEMIVSKPYANVAPVTRREW
jgi:alcohol dehydrogenase class IV